MKGYDEWKTRLPPEPPEDPDCTCVRRRDPWCPVHGKDPDAERDKIRDEGGC
jgi:hypothetical protein